MIEMQRLESERLESDKETDNKLRWNSDIDGVEFKLYIFKWRVPQPWPSRIYVNIEPVPPGFMPQQKRRTQVDRDPSLAEAPIIAKVTRYSDHTETVRLQPVGDPKEWEIGEPYIPKNIDLVEQSDELLIRIEWDLASRGKFRGDR